MTISRKRLYVLFVVGIVLLLALIAYFSYNSKKEVICEEIQFLYADDSLFVIHPFYNSSQDCYVVVLPSSWVVDSVYVRYKNNYSKFPYIDDSNKFLLENRVFQCYRTNQPCVFINTNSGTMNAIEESKDKKVKEGGLCKIIDVDGNLDYMGDFKSIGGRGNGTWRENIKKPYNLNMGKRLSVLGMQEGKKYCLLSNNMDRSNARNFIAYNFAKKLNMQYAVDERYISLFLNGMYNGLYLLTNDISVKDADYFFQYCGFSNEKKRKNDNYLWTKHGGLFRIKRPKRVDIKEVNSLVTFYDDFMNSLIGSDSSSQDFTSFINMESFSKHYLLSEFFYNYDGGNLYLCKKDTTKNSKIVAASIWDFDQSMGMHNESNKVIYNRSDVYYFKNGCNNIDNCGVIGELCKKRIFVDCIKRIFKNELLPYCSTFFNGKDYIALRNNLQHENEIDYNRWPIDNEREDLSEIRNFLLERLSFLQKEMWENKTDEYSLYVIIANQRKNLNRICEIPVQKNSMCELPELHYLTFHGWQNSHGQDMGDCFLAKSDTIVYAKWWELPSGINIDRKDIRLFYERIRKLL